MNNPILIEYLATGEFTVFCKRMDQFYAMLRDIFDTNYSTSARFLGFEVDVTTIAH